AQREERAVARHIERAQERPSAASSAHTQRESRSATPVLQAQSASQSQSQNQRLQPAQATPRNSAAVQNSQALTQQGNQPPASAQPADQQLLVAANQGSASQTANNVAGENAGAPATTTPDTSAEGGFFSWVFSWTSMVLLLLVGIVSFFVVRKRRRAADEFWPEEETKGLTAGAKAKVSAEAESGSRNARAVEQGQGAERRRSGRRSSDQQATAQSNGRSGQNESQEQALDVRAPSTPELFGAYRVDQEVNKMILGQPHRSDVLASRSSDDRRAIETSLIKCMMDDELGEDARERARQALEDYGFVARESAALLLAHSAVDRVSAARTLGEVGSPAALPFLLEALYDSEPIVRTQAVNSLGELKQPAAIGALLDLAWRHPEIPAPLLSRVLSACSLECEQVLGGLTFEQDTPRERRLDVFTGEITGFEPATDIEALPDWLEDEEMEEALSRLESTDVEARTAAARSLAQFQVQRAVDALALMATRDTESTVRSTAVSSLGSIGHESVFAPVIIAFADEAREVRAAAARSLSRLGFDRADAYVRLAESPNMEILQQVARACIKGGMVSQALDRLASEDRRQAYEAFSLLSILARANEVEPILDAIEHHGSMEVRLNAVRLLGMAGQPQLLQQLRHLAVRDNVPEKVRTALLEVVYKIDQMQPA
ncbi:MAG TPA: HEAT repeat domain-containing protein, partial [Pyrinomonadaceae bacterium]|nr:HEAT repeat domain-containing protein [Pyrinomonadaceae bacterium]